MKTFKLSFEDYLQAQKLHLGLRGRLLSIGLIFFGGTIGLAPVYIIHSTDKNFGLNPAFLILILIIIIIFPYLQKKNFKKNYDSQKTLQEDIKVTFDNKFIKWKSDSGHYKVIWEDILKYKFNKKIIIIYEANNIIRLIPIRIFEDAIEKKIFLKFISRSNITCDTI